MARRKNPRRAKVKIPKWLSKNIGKTIHFKLRYIKNAAASSGVLKTIHRGRGKIYVVGRNWGLWFKIEDIKRVPAKQSKKYLRKRNPTKKHPTKRYKK